ncbi:hypothetical protein ACNKHP_16655 [Shigella boydii]
MQKLNSRCLTRHGSAVLRVVTFTSGNVSAIDPERGLVVIQAQWRRLRNDESGRDGGG